MLDSGSWCGCIHLRQSGDLRQLFYSPALTDDSPTCSPSEIAFVFFVFFYLPEGT